MQDKIKAAPTVVYPESDGNPFAETEYHRDIMIDFIQMLKHYFRDVDDVHVSGNLLMYYEEGNPRKSVSPDVFVAFGVSKKKRRTYKIWEEGHAPNFVLEVASPSTYRHDLTRKKDLYASVLGVREYYIYDPYHEVDPYFHGYRLVGGVYEDIEFVDERLPSLVLDLELGENDGVFGLYDPNRSVWLQPLEEQVKQETEARQRADARAEQEAEARQRVESELAKALEALKRLEEKS
ncbi:Uma2 family endonuclease [Candidatus Poribacteria bacterium]|nr:Uma2 family endonuclease [Candidatus Poribacteria bacterium]